MRNNRTLLIAIAIALLGLTLWVHFGPDKQVDSTPALTTAELAALQPDLDGDLRLMEELRRQVGLEANGWTALPQPGQVLYVTLWAEEIQRTRSWEQAAELDAAALGLPSFATVAEAYETLGCRDLAARIRILGQRVEQARPALLAWITQRADNAHAPRPVTTPIDVAARSAFANLTPVRRQRLSYATANAADCGIR